MNAPKFRLTFNLLSFVSPLPSSLSGFPLSLAPRCLGSRVTIPTPHRHRQWQQVNRSNMLTTPLKCPWLDLVSQPRDFHFRTHCSWLALDYLRSYPRTVSHPCLSNVPADCFTVTREPIKHVWRPQLSRPY